MLRVGLGSRMRADQCAKLLGVDSLLDDCALPQRIVDLVNRDRDKKGRLMRCFTSRRYFLVHHFISSMLFPIGSEREARHGSGHALVAQCLKTLNQNNRSPVDRQTIEVSVE